MPVEDFDPEDPEFSIQNGETLNKHKTAGEIAEKALNLLTPHVQPGAKVVDLAVAADNFIMDEVKKVYGKLKAEKGVAFPTCICVNHVAGNNSPLADDTSVLAEGDVVKIDLGVHIDGYIAQGAHTVVAGQDGPITGRLADLYAATNTAMEAALRLVRPGKKNMDITEAIALVAKDFGVTPLEGTLGHELKRYNITGENSILCRGDDDEKKPDEFEFEDFSVYTIDVAFSDGDGRPRQKDSRTTIYRRDEAQMYSLKMAAARQLNSEIAARFHTLPFTLRSFEEVGKAKLGLTELTKHDMVDAFPITQTKEGEKIVRLSSTVLLLPSGVTRLVTCPLPAFESDKKAADPKLTQILAMSTKRTKRKQKKKK